MALASLLNPFMLRAAEGARVERTGEVSHEALAGVAGGGG